MQILTQQSEGAFTKSSKLSLEATTNAAIPVSDQKSLSIFASIQIVLDFFESSRSWWSLCKPIHQLNRLPNLEPKSSTVKALNQSLRKLKTHPKTVQSQINFVSAPSFLLHLSSSPFLNIQESYLRQLLSRFHGWVPLGKQNVHLLFCVFIWRERNCKSLA